MSAKKLTGKIVSDVADKTVTVVVSGYKKHPKYRKYVTSNKKYKAHDESNEYKTGDKVIIEECSPISKDKHFRVLNKI